MMPETSISELLDLPEQVHSGDFVLNLSEGVTADKAERTLRRLRRHAAAGRRLRQRPGLHPVGRRGAATARRAYLHGSFGSGKSHFMAVLHLLLQHDPAPGPTRAWRGSASSTTGSRARSSCSCRTT